MILSLDKPNYGNDQILSNLNLNDNNTNTEKIIQKKINNENQDQEQDKKIENISMIGEMPKIFDENILNSLKKFSKFDDPSEINNYEDCINLGPCEIKNGKGQFYEGQWKNGFRHGKGKYIDNNGFYEGYWENN